MCLLLVTYELEVAAVLDLASVGPLVVLERKSHCHRDPVVGPVSASGLLSSVRRHLGPVGVILDREPCNMHHFLTSVRLCHSSKLFTTSYLMAGASVDPDFVSSGHLLTSTTE